MTLDYTKMFLIVTEEAVVKGHFAVYGAFFAAGWAAFLLRFSILWSILGKTKKKEAILWNWYWAGPKATPAGWIRK